MKTAKQIIRSFNCALPLLILHCMIEVVNGITVEDVWSAWSKDRDQIRTMQFDCTLRRTELVAKESSNPLGLPDGMAPSVPVALTSRITFSIAGDKIACLRLGEIWSGNRIVRQTQSACFNGQESRALFPTDKFSIGEITTGAVRDSLTKHIDLDAIYFTCDPLKYLDRLQQDALSRIVVAASASNKYRNTPMPPTVSTTPTTTIAFRNKLLLPSPSQINATPARRMPNPIANTFIG